MKLTVFADDFQKRRMDNFAINGDSHLHQLFFGERLVFIDEFGDDFLEASGFYLGSFFSSEQLQLTGEDNKRHDLSVLDKRQHPGWRTRQLFHLAIDGVTH